MWFGTNGKVAQRYIVVSDSCKGLEVGVSIGPSQVHERDTQLLVRPGVEGALEISEV